MIIGEGESEAPSFCGCSSKLLDESLEFIYVFTKVLLMAKKTLCDYDSIPPQTLSFQQPPEV